MESSGPVTINNILACILISNAHRVSKTAHSITRSHSTSNKEAIFIICFLLSISPLETGLKPKFPGLWWTHIHMWMGRGMESGGNQFHALTMCPRSMIQRQRLFGVPCNINGSGGEDSNSACLWTFVPSALDACNQVLTLGYAPNRTWKAENV